MRVQVGPMPSGGVSLWVAYARTVLAQAGTGQLDDDVTLPPAALDTFERFLDEWEAEARRSTEFLWVADVEPEQAEYLALAYFHLVQVLAVGAAKRGFPLAPPEGEQFYRALVTAFLDALAQEGEANAAFVDELRESWPGFKPEV